MAGKFCHFGAGTHNFETDCIVIGNARSSVLVLVPYSIIRRRPSLQILAEHRQATQHDDAEL